MKRRLWALLLLLTLVLAACGREDAAPPAASPATASESLSGFAPAQPAPYESVRVYFDGLLSDRAFRRGDAVFVSPDALCRFLDLELKTAADPGSFTLEFPGLTVSGSTADPVIRADSRYLYTPDGSLCYDGRVYLSPEVLGHLFGIGWRVSGDRVDLRTQGARLLQGGENYYTDHYAAEELFWLFHIIHAESANQPLEGQIAVGSVVLNRVASENYPNSIREVVLQRSTDGVQFEPTADGNVLNAVDEQSVVAGCLALEGFQPVADCMYFVNPVTGDTRWFDSNHQFYTTIGDHDFYR